MTSNMGAQTILENFEDLEAVGDQHRTEIIETTKLEVFEALKENLRPEFLNRIDEKIMFLPLTKEEIKQIAKLLLKKVKKNLARQELKIELDESALEYLADLGYDPQFGARPLKRVIQKELVNELSKQVLSGAFAAGDIIYVGTGPKGLTFSEEKGKSSKVESKPKSRSGAKSNGQGEREKNLDKLMKATKDVEDAVKDMEEEGGAAPKKEEDEDSGK